MRRGEGKGEDGTGREGGKREKREEGRETRDGRRKMREGGRVKGEGGRGNGRGEGSRNQGNEDRGVKRGGGRIPLAINSDVILALMNLHCVVLEITMCRTLLRGMRRSETTGELFNINELWLLIPPEIV